MTISSKLPDRLVEQIWRSEAPKVTATLTRMLRDISLAEELAQDAMMIALKTWPEAGVPRNPGAWLMATAKRRAIDYFRRNKMAARKLEMLAHELDDAPDASEAVDAMLDDEVGDDLLSMIFTACHPILSLESRAALALKLVAGLSTTEIARAFLVAEPTIAQRIVRAKRTIAEANLPFEVPRGAERQSRLDSVLAVVYLVFNEGYSATAGESLIRPALMDEAMRLGDILARLARDEPEVQGLVALMALQTSRRAARLDAEGWPILLQNQDRRLWDRALITKGLTALARARALDQGAGEYVLQAAIAACHAQAPDWAATDWSHIAGLYQDLYSIARNPVVALNHAVAVGMADGPAEGLRLIDVIAASGALKSYHLLPSVRGEFLVRLGRSEEAALEYRRAAEMTQNVRERGLLLRRAADLAKP